MPKAKKNQEPTRRSNRIAEQQVYKEEILNVSKILYAFPRSEQREESRKYAKELAAKSIAYIKESLMDEDHDEDNNVEYIPGLVEASDMDYEDYFEEPDPEEFIR